MKNPCHPSPSTSTPAAKPKQGDMGGAFASTASSNAGNSGRSIRAGDFPRNPKQKDSGPSGGGGKHRNLVGPGDPGNKGY